MVDARPADAVAGELELTANAVNLARGRVLRRLRAELAGRVECVRFPLPAVGRGVGTNPLERGTAGSGSGLYLR